MNVSPVPDQPHPPSQDGPAATASDRVARTRVRVPPVRVPSLGTLALRVPRLARLPLGLGLICLAVSFAQRAGLTVTDTRIELSANPGLFLPRVAEVFSGTGDLGHVQSGQFVGYLVPMGPWFALTHAAGLPTWVAQRLWLALLLFAAAYGMVKLLDAMIGPRRGLAHAVGGFMYAMNPFVVVFVSRATVNLLALDILPWLMLAVLRGIRQPRAWRWPAVIGVLGALSGGGVNAAMLAWIAIAPVGLLVWEATVGGAGASAAGSFGVRALLCGLAGSAWWIIPVYLQSPYAATFLSFTEQPRGIWATTSMSESLRLLGYWPIYFGTGYGAAAPEMSVGQTYLFEPLVVVATFVVPAAALLGLRITRRWFYAPFFGLLAAVSLTAMCAGFPNGTAFSHVLGWLYTNVQGLQFLRTTYRAAPVLALSLAALGGVAAEALLARVRARERRLTLPAVGIVLLAGATIVWVLPLFDGTAIDRPLAYGHVPPAWSRAVAAAGRAGRQQAHAGAARRAVRRLSLGNTWSSVAPALGRRPVAIRQVVQYADPRSAELLDDIDNTVQQARLVPGDSAPLLRLLGVGQVLVATDALDSQSGGLDPADVAAALTGQPGFSTPLASSGRAACSCRSWVAMARCGPSPSCGATGFAAARDSYTSMRRTRDDPRRRPHGDRRGLRRDGSAPILATDLLRRRPRIGRALRLVDEGARLVFSDSNRRDVVASSYVREDVGPTLTASAPDPVERLDLGSVSGRGRARTDRGGVLRSESHRAATFRGTAVPFLCARGGGRRRPLDRMAAECHAGVVAVLDAAHVRGAEADRNDHGRAQTGHGRRAAVGRDLCQRRARATGAARARTRSRADRRVAVRALRFRLTHVTGSELLSGRAG